MTKFGTGNSLLLLDRKLKVHSLFLAQHYNFVKIEIVISQEVNLIFAR